MHVPDAIRGRVLISCLALFCMSMVRFLYPELRTMTAETMVSELTSFSLTVHWRRNGLKRRIFSNFGVVIRSCTGGNRLFRCRRHPDRHRYTRSHDPILLTGNRESAVENQSRQRECCQ